MKKRKSSPTLDKTIAYLTSNIKNGTWQNAQRLPNHTALAHEVGVGHTTMVKALAVLKSKKMVVYKEKVGIFVGATLPQKTMDPTQNTKQLKWESIKEAIKKDVLEGKFRDTGLLPTSKELSSRYKADFRTVQKAFDHLVRDNLIVHDKQRYAVRQLRQAVSGKTIYLIASPRFLNAELYDSEKKGWDEFLQALEKECTEKQVTLQKLPLNKGITIPGPTISILGIVLWHSEDLNSNTSELIHYLRALKKPVAVYIYPQSETLHFTELTKLYGKHPSFFVSDPTADKQAGIKIGTHLFDKGHKQVCYFSHSCTAHWTLQRLEGLREAFCRVNLPNAVVPIVREEFSGNDFGQFTLQRDRDYAQSLDREIAFLDATIEASNNNLPSPFSGRLGTTIQDIKFARNYLPYYTPLFRKAMAVPGATAWVCSDDPLAYFGALEFLARERIKNPGQIGVVGFGNFSESTVRGLTSYHFDFAGAARKMVMLVMYPEYAKRSLCIKGTNIFEVDGMVIERGSA